MTTKRAVSWRLLLALTAMIAAPIVPMLAPAAASARVTVTWDNDLYGRFLEIFKASSAAGAQADAFTSNGNANQKWVKEDIGVCIGEGCVPAPALKNSNSNLCLADFDGDLNAIATQRACKDADANQGWGEETAPGGGWWLVNAAHGQFLCAEPTDGTAYWAQLETHTGTVPSRCVWH